MEFQIMGLMDIVGTIAFAVSGAVVASEKDMDIFGFIFLGIVTATGGGMIRDLIIGRTPPAMFLDPRYVAIAAVSAGIVFLVLNRHREFPGRLAELSERVYFIFDTLGLAAFTVDGIYAGRAAGFSGNAFLLIYLGLMTGIGGGLLRDVFAARPPVILRKQVYATASIAGGIVTILMSRATYNEPLSAMAGAAVIVAIRVLAAHYRWDLPKL